VSGEASTLGSRTSLEPDVLSVGREEGEDVLLGSRCTRCGRYFFPQRVWCGGCAEPTTEVVELSRQGTLTSFTRLHRKPEYSIIEPPYILGEVTLPEGLRIYSVITTKDDTDPTMGQAVGLRSIQVREQQGGAVFAYAFAPT
jgi:uncharacterized OB-fold protein